MVADHDPENAACPCPRADCTLRRLPVISDPAISAAMRALGGDAVAAPAGAGAPDYAAIRSWHEPVDLGFVTESGQPVTSCDACEAEWPCDATQLLDRVEALETRSTELKVALAEAAIPLEALYAAEHDGRALAPATKAAIRHGIMVARRALGIGQGGVVP